MATNDDNSMLCVTASRFTDPSQYELTRLPVPAVSEPTDVRIEVHAASINPIDVKKAAGALKQAVGEKYVPFPPSLPCEV